MEKYPEAFVRPDEHHRMTCLEVINEFIRDTELLSKYLKMAELDNRPHISQYIKELRSKQANE